MAAAARRPRVVAAAASAASRRSSGRPLESPPAHQVEVEVVDRLAAPRADVGDDPVARARRCPRPGRCRPRPRTSPRAARRRPRQVGGGRDVRPGSGGCGSAPAARCRGIARTSVVLVDPVDGDRRRPRSGRRGSRRRDPVIGSAAVIGSPQLRLRAHQEPDRADQAGHHVRDVALPARPRLSTRRRRPRPDPDEAAQVRALDEEREARG